MALLNMMMGLGVPEKEKRKSLLSLISGAPEQMYPGQLEKGNIDYTKRPVVLDPQGQPQTLRSMSWPDIAGTWILAPSITSKGRVLMNEDEARKYYDDTGEFMGRFDSQESAENYAKSISASQDKQYYWDRKTYEDWRDEQRRKK